MTEDDQPPEHIWLDQDAVTAHFEWVRQKYQNRASGGTTESVPDPGGWDQNEMTAGWR